jgi:all-trans-retinol dehydrogenase (NAD+)
MDEVAPNVHYYKTDITSSKAIAEVASSIRSSYGHPTVLINNAGIGFGYTILEVPEDSLRKIFEVNTISHFLTVKEFLPEMVKQNHGHVVTVASMASFVTIAQNTDYSCTKAGAMAFHEGLTQELKHRYRAPKVRTR